jgi:hypothetical protein
VEHSLPSAELLFAQRGWAYHNSSRNSSALRPVIARMLRSVPFGMSLPACTGTETVRPSACAMMWWLPLILAVVKPARSSALITFAPGTAGTCVMTAAYAPNATP